MAERPRIQVLLNPVSGGGWGRSVLTAICRRIREAGWSVRIHATQGPGDARETARRSCLACDRALVVAGGDGTVSEVVGGMEGVGVPILVVPWGTENIVAKYFRTRLDADWLWQVLRAGREALVDVPAMNRRSFLILGGVGFDAEVAHRLNRDRRRHITHLDYLWPTWRTFWGYRYPRVSVETDGTMLFEGPGLVFVGNLPRYAVGLRILDLALPDDGLLDVCVMACGWVGGQLRHSWNVALRRHVGRAGVLYERARRVRVWAEDRVPVQLDGDPAGWLPAEFEMTPSRARFLVSAGWSR